MSELKALRDRTAARLIAAEVASSCIKAPWLPTTDAGLPVLLVTARRSRMSAESKGGNIGHPAFIERGTVLIGMRRMADDAEALEDALLDDQTAILSALLDDADWLAQIEGVETIDITIQPPAAQQMEATMADLIIEITASWRMDYGPGGVPLREIRGTVPVDPDPDFNPAFGVDHLDQ